MAARSTPTRSAAVPRTEPTTVRKWIDTTGCSGSPHHLHHQLEPVIGDSSAPKPEPQPGRASWSVIIQVAAAGPAIAAVIVLAFASRRPGLVGLGRSMIRWRVNPPCYALHLPRRAHC